MHAAMPRLRVLGQYEEAELFGAKTGASKGGFYTQKEGSGNYVGDDDDDGSPVQEIEPGLLEMLPPGWDFKPFDPQHPTTAFQPFVNYNMKDGWYLSSSPTITSNWSAESSQQWTIPIGGGVGRVFHIGKQPVNASLRAYHNLQSPRSGSDWQLQFQIQFLFPK